MKNETQKLLGAEIFFLYLQARCFFMQGDFLQQVKVYEGVEYINGAFLNREFLRVDEGSEGGFSKY